MPRNIGKDDFKGYLQRELECGYTPNERVRDFARRMNILAVIGATSVGKDTTMRFSGLHVVKGKTSRSRRPSDIPPTYEFIDTSEEFAIALDDVVAGNFVQVIQHPTTGELYGTLDQHFQGPTLGAACLMDVTAQEYQRVREENPLFGSFRGVCITAPLEEWGKRQAERDDNIGRVEKALRLKEALHSLYICLETPEDMEYILNDVLSTAATELHALGQGESLDDERRRNAREAGYLMLDLVLTPVG